MSLGYAKLTGSSAGSMTHSSDQAPNASATASNLVDRLSAMIGGASSLAERTRHLADLLIGVVPPPIPSDNSPENSGLLPSLQSRIDLLSARLDEISSDLSRMERVLI